MKGSIWKNTGFFFAVTLISIILGRIVEYFVHESGHYLAARLMGITFQADPVQILLTTPFLVKVYPTGIFGFTESLAYTQYTGVFGPGVGFIAIGGLIMNALIAVFCFWIFLKTRGIRYRSVMTVLLWILIFNLGALYSFIPLRVFSFTGDVAIFLSSFWIHPVIFLFPAIILILVGFFLYFSIVLPLYCISIPVKSHVMRIFILICSTIILFMYMTGPVLSEFRLSDVMSFPDITSVFPLILIGQSILLVAVFILGLMRIHNLDASRYLRIKKMSANKVSNRKRE